MRLEFLINHLVTTRFARERRAIAVDGQKAILDQRDAQRLHMVLEHEKAINEEFCPHMGNINFR